MRYQVTVRYGVPRQRHYTYAVEAADVRAALGAAADQMPADVRASADLVELRVAVDPDARAYVEEAR
jgi:hypothetical protein